MKRSNEFLVSNGGDITAPDSVAEGSQAPIEITAPAGTSQVIVTVIGGSTQFVVDIDDDGKAQFELPPDAVSGTSITIIDVDDFSRSAQVDVDPASLLGN